MEGTSTWCVGGSVRIEDCEDLAAARHNISAAARQAGLDTAVAMLVEALSQMEALAPSLSAEVWSAYGAVLAATASDHLPDTTCR